VQGHWTLNTIVILQGQLMGAESDCEVYDIDGIATSLQLDPTASW